MDNSFSMFFGETSEYPSNDFQSDTAEIDFRRGMFGESSVSILKDFLNQTKDLKYKKASFICSDSQNDSILPELISHASSIGMMSSVYSDGIGLSEKTIRLILQNRGRITLPLYSLNPARHDGIAGKQGSFSSVMQALSYVRQQGCHEDDFSLCIILCAENESELEQIINFLQQQKIYSKAHLLTFNDNTEKSGTAGISSAAFQTRYMTALQPYQLKQIFDRVRLVQESFPLNHAVFFPGVSYQDLHLLHTCASDMNGNIAPASDFFIPIGNIRINRLHEILQSSLLFQKIRTYKTAVKEPCRSCPHIGCCMGRRAETYMATGDYLAADPLCPLNENKKNQIFFLPSDASEWIPHRPPISMVNRILEYSEWISVDSVIQENNRFLRDGVLDNDVLPEIAAQAVAVSFGFERNQKNLKGVLTGLRNVVFRKSARIGDRLIIKTHETVNLGMYHTVSFVILFEDGTECAEGEISSCEIL